MKGRATVFRGGAAALALLMLLTVFGCLAGCKRPGAEATQLSVSTGSITVGVDETAYFAVAVKGSNEDGAGTPKLNANAKSKGKIWEGRRFGTAVYDAARSAENAIDLDRGYYVVPDDKENASLPSLLLGIGTINFVTMHTATAEGENSAVEIYAVTGKKEGAEEWTFTSGDLTATVIVTVTA